MTLRLIHGWMIVLMVAVLGLGVLTPVLSNSLLPVSYTHLTLPTTPYV